MSARTHRPPHGGRPEERRPLRQPPPPDDPVYPELAARYGGPDGLADELEDLLEAERLIGQWPAEFQNQYGAALHQARARRHRRQT
jgi:hypothetical protein